MDILSKWGTIGTDVAYVGRCLELASRRYLVSCDEDAKNCRNKEEIDKEQNEKWIAIKKNLENMINLVNQNPYFTNEERRKEIAKYEWQLGIHNIRKPPRKTKEKFDHLDLYYEEVDDFIYEKIPIEVSMVLIYEHLLDIVGKRAYGRPKTLPSEFLEDLLSLFHTISPEDFPSSLSLNTLSKKISETREKCEYLSFFERKIRWGLNRV